MTATLISLISILVGIIGANTAGFIFKKYTLGLTGNTIVGVFGSVFLIKSIGRLGFDPKSIVQVGNIDFKLFILNLLVSFLGGAITMLIVYKIKTRFF